MTAAVLQILPKPKGRQAIADGRHVLKMFPSWQANLTRQREWIYAIAFEGGVVKIGRSKNPRSRLTQHWTAAKGQVLWIHLFTPCHRATAMRLEAAVSKTLKGIAKQINGSEWYFGGEDKRTVVLAIRKALDRCRAEVQRELDSRQEHHVLRERAIAALIASGVISSKERTWA
jgi:hypothetical protein